MHFTTPNALTKKKKLRNIKFKQIRKNIVNAHKHSV